ncbi:MAG: hypothetical protein GF404_11915 [candidate division Zixibacteria bacterium]|nr:hypothetical protein [candidate division Zixibacteria bacterium]
MLTKKIIYLVLVVFVIGVASLSHAEEFIIYYHGQPIEKEIVDDLVTVRIAGFDLQEAYDYAHSHSFLDNDFNIEIVGPGFYLFGITSGHDYESIAHLLRDEDTVLMVNPVLESLEEGVMYLDNRIFTSLHLTLSSQLCSFSLYPL